MTGWAQTALVIGMILITLTSLAVTLTMTWWVLDSLNRRWTGAQKREAGIDQTSRQMVENFGKVVEGVTTLTEHLILGRPVENAEKLELLRTQETSQTPDEVWSGLPDNIRQAMAREDEERSAWPTASEMLVELRQDPWVDEDPSPSQTP